LVYKGRHTYTHIRIIFKWPVSDKEISDIERVRERKRLRVECVISFVKCLCWLRLNWQIYKLNNNAINTTTTTTTSASCSTRFLQCIEHNRTYSFIHCLPCLALRMITMITHNQTMNRSNTTKKPADICRCLTYSMSSKRFEWIWMC